MSNNNHNQDDYPNISATGSNGEISPMELESLANGDDSYSKNKGSNNKSSMDRLTSSVLPKAQFQQLVMLLRLYLELYPRFMMAMMGSLLTILLLWWSPWNGRSSMSRNYMTHDYTTLQDNFNFQKAQIDHWCLFGGDDKCFCEDPMEPMGREEVKGWVVAHQRNKLSAAAAVVTQNNNKGGVGVDVVFLGDQTVQAWDGKWLDKTAPQGHKIEEYFNNTFRSQDSQFQGLPLGIYGDRINNILWRIQHGELPEGLTPKVFWLIMGTNDLAVGMCSEEVVTLGIMRVAEELHHHYPQSVIVIQGILPRSNHNDGSLEGKTSKYAKRGNGKRLPRKFTGGSPTIGSEHKQDGGTTYDPSFPNGVRRNRRQLLQHGTDNNHHHHQPVTEHYYNPMDDFLDNYLDHYDDPNMTQELLAQLWGAHANFEDSIDDDPESMGRHRALEDDGGGNGDDDAAGDGDDDATTKTTDAPVAGTTTATTDAPAAETTTATTDVPAATTVGPATATTDAPVTTAGPATTEPLVKTPIPATTQAPVKPTFTATSGEAKTQTSSGGSVMTSPQRDYKYEDAGKILPGDNKSRLPRFDFYLWPSIKAINKELEGFCEKHEHFVYFDADDLVLGSLGNKHYKQAHKTIIKDLMPNFVHLSFQGHKVVMDVIREELKRIIYDEDERNDIETQD